MSDIIKRLRDWEKSKPQLDCPQYLLDEAADEIERLRNIVIEFVRIGDSEYAEFRPQMVDLYLIAQKAIGQDGLQ
jgi:hypothetical protein